MKRLSATGPVYTGPQVFLPPICFPQWAEWAFWNVMRYVTSPLSASPGFHFTQDEIQSPDLGNSVYHVWGCCCFPTFLPAHLLAPIDCSHDGLRAVPGTCQAHHQHLASVTILFTSLPGPENLCSVSPGRSHIPGDRCLLQDQVESKASSSLSASHARLV